MRLKLQPPSQGLVWVRQGFAMLRTRPMLFAGLFLMFLLGSAMLLSVPLIGPAVMLGLLPTVTVGFMLASKSTQEAQTTPSPMVLLEPLRSKSARLLWQQGLAYGLMTVLVMWLGDALDGGRLAQWQAENRNSEAMASIWEAPGVLNSLMIRLALATPVSILFWHAGALAYWHQVSLGKAMFFSVMAIVKNFGAFVVYGLAWVGVISAFALALQLVLLILGSPGVASAAALPGAIIFSSAYYASLYFTYLDCFESATVTGTIEPT